MLLQVYDSTLDFTVTQSGKKSKKVNGLYKPDTHEIILHNKNFNSENQLIYTALHEYTHHVIAEKQLELNGSAYIPNAKVHTQAFWAKFQELLTIAEDKGFYKLDISGNQELVALTEKIKKDYLEANGRLMQEFGRLLLKAHTLCESANIRYEDYVDRILCLPRTSARDITRVGTVDVNPAVGFDNMKMISAIKTSDGRSDAQNKILKGTSPVTVREMMRHKSQEEPDDPKTKLEKEKQRLSKTIEHLQQRLNFVEESLANL